MKREFYLPQRAFMALALCATVAISGCKPNPPPLTAQEQHTVNALTQDMQTHCWGRFLVDLPKGMQGYTQQVVGYSREVVIETQSTPSQEAFKLRMQELEAYYKAKISRDHIVLENGVKVLREKGRSYLFSTSAPSPEVRLFEILRNEEHGAGSKLIEGYKWSNGQTIKMVIEATEASLESAEDAAMTIKLKWSVPQRIEQMTSLLQRARGRADNEIPTEPGFCFSGGFLAGKAFTGDSVRDVEEFNAVFDFKDMPDVQVNFMSNNDISADETLTERPDLDKLVAQNNGTVLRKGSVKLPGIAQAEEWMLEGDVPQRSGKIILGHYFKLEGNSKMAAPQTPFFELEMQNGAATESQFDDKGKYITRPASLTQAEVLKLWDAVSKSVRMRPGAL
jgi:Tle cognate immunity protein 4 C-terminal domain/Tle cognate immunity protein 4 N-terminal domain